MRWPERVTLLTSENEEVGEKEEKDGNDADEEEQGGGGGKEERVWWWDNEAYKCRVGTMRSIRRVSMSWPGGRVDYTEVGGETDSRQAQKGGQVKELGGRVVGYSSGADNHRRRGKEARGGGFVRNAEMRG